MQLFGIFAVITLSFYAESTIASEIPNTVHKCKYGDYDCIAQSMQNVIAAYGKTGIREMNLIPFDPLHVKSLKLDKNPNSPVNIELSFKDVDVIGLSDAKVLRVRGYTSNLNENMEFEVESPKVTLKGPYTVDGSVLILPIVGSGNSEIILENVVFSLKTKNHGSQKNGKNYLEFDSIKLDIKPKRVQFKLENLFNGNKELGENMNRFINENWQDIFSELQPPISEAFSLIVKHILSNVFSKSPYETFFQNE